MITVIANLKGGSGKSTVAFNLAIWLMLKGENVTAYDLDPQQTLSDVAKLRQQDGTEPALQVQAIQGDVVASDLNNHHGHVLIDVGAANMTAMKQAIGEADRVVIPVQPSQPDVWATQRFLKIVEEACDGSKTPELIAFINRADTHCSVTESDEAEEVLNMLDALHVLSNRLCQRTNFRRALSEGLSIFELSGKNKATDEFEKLAEALYPELTS